MDIGKIPADRLKKIVIDQIGYKRDDVLVHAGIGEDSAVLDLEGDLLVVSSDPITGAANNAGYLAVHVACNDLAAAGAEPVAIQLVLLLPPEIEDVDIANLMKDISTTAESINVEIIGGHTEILSAVSKPIISVTAVGRSISNKVISSAGCTAGDDLVLTKGVGIEGTYILACDYPELLAEKGVSSQIISAAEKYGEKLSVIKEGKIGARTGANAMHDITEGGLYGALDELAYASGTGFKVDLDKLIINEETEVISKALNIDPAGLISSGSMLIAISDSKVLISKLGEIGVNAVKIGEITKNDKFLLKDGNKKKFQWKQKDELWCLMERFPKFS
ncbi:MAG: AIR synthase family protein [Halothermotrichaceae bacterium]